MSQQETIAVAAQGDYPPIEVAEPNARYAAMLQQDLASAKSEMSAIYQYLYQDWILTPKRKEMAGTIRRIAAVEMHHLNILGQLIILLGGNPKCQAYPVNPGTAWNGNMINYTKNLPQLLRNDMMMEYGAYTTYETQAKAIKDPHVSEQLLRIAQDERLHHKIFESFLDQVQ